jgi:hypothetical protein
MALDISRDHFGCIDEIFAPQKCDNRTGQQPACAGLHHKGGPADV